MLLTVPQVFNTYDAGVFFTDTTLQQHSYSREAIFDVYLLNSVSWIHLALFCTQCKKEGNLN